MVDVEVMQSIPLFLPMLRTLKVLSKTMQKSDLYYADVSEAIKTTKAQITELYEGGLEKVTTDSRFEAWQQLNNGEGIAHLYNMEGLLYFKVPNQGASSPDIDIVEREGGFVRDADSIFMEDEEEDGKYFAFPLRVHESRRTVVNADVDSWHKVTDALLECCSEAAKVLVQEFDERFPAVELLDAMAIVDPRFWANPVQLDERTKAALQVLKKQYGNPILVPNSAPVTPLLDSKRLDQQLASFKIAMETGKACGSMTSCWQVLASMPTMFKSISEFARLAELVIAIPVCSVENERVFSVLKYIKSPIRNKLTVHLNTAVRMFAQSSFTLEDFDYDKAFEFWMAATTKGRYGLTKPTLPARV
jgi:hypothetical protein